MKGMHGSNKVQAKGLSNTPGNQRFGSMKKETSNIKSTTVGKLKSVKSKKK